MKVAVSTSGKTLDSPFNPRFGRCPGFLVYDTETGDTKYLGNSDNMQLPQGAGIQAAKKISEAGTEALITGQIGPRAARVLDQTSISLYACSGGTVRQALTAFQENNLTEMATGDIRTGPGKRGGRGAGGGRGRQ